MSPPPRRRVLQLAAGALVATAGCSDETTSDEPPDPDAYEYVEDPEHESVRAAGTEPVVSIEPLMTSSAEGLPAFDWELFVTETGASELRFQREPAGIEAARSFLEATRFDEESLFVLQETVPECRTIELPRLRREPSERVPEPDFCIRLRPPDVPCSEGAEDTEVHLVRLPVGLDDRPSEYGFSSGSDCDPPPTQDDGGDGR